jgi:predicted nucleic acid-binding protein
VLSNFARLRIERLITDAVPDCATTPEVLRELRDGAALGHLSPDCDFRWLRIVMLNEEERQIFSSLNHRGLGAGEWSCIAVAVARKCSVFTDDKLARRFTQKLPPAGEPIRTIDPRGYNQNA